jgi:hypothetical protein
LAAVNQLAFVGGGIGRLDGVSKYCAANQRPARRLGPPVNRIRRRRAIPQW